MMWVRTMASKNQKKPIKWILAIFAVAEIIIAEINRALGWTDWRQAIVGTVVILIAWSSFRYLPDVKQPTMDDSEDHRK